MSVSSSRARVAAVASTAMIAAKLWLTAGQWRSANTLAVHDDGLFLRLAGHLVRGEWLGPYGNTTLVKGPGYPLWIAASSLVGLPLHLADHLLYAAACLAFAAAARPWLPRPELRLAVFAVLLFNPMSTGVHSLTYGRDMLYATQSLAVVGLALGLLLRIDGPWHRLLGWSAGLGLSLSWAWVTREEVLVSAAVLALRGLRGAARRELAAKLVVLSLPVAAVLAARAGIEARNAREYGVPHVCELKSPEFLAAYGALARVRHARPLPWVLLPREARRRIYAASPAFRELRPFLEGSVGEMWGHIGHEHVPRRWRSESAQEILTGWFVWALRDAVLLAGHGESGPDALAYYARLASSVNEACGSGRLQCEAQRASLAPPWRPEYLGRTLQAALWWSRALVRLHAGSPEPFPSSGTRQSIAAARVLTGDRILTARHAAEEARLPQLDRRRIAVLRAVARVYHAVLPWWSAATVLALAALAAARALGRNRGGGGVLLLLGIALASRLGTMSFVLATAIPVPDPRYALPAYALLLAMCACCTAKVLHGPTPQARLVPEDPLPVAGGST
jgi:hypothetical protein